MDIPPNGTGHPLEAPEGRRVSSAVPVSPSSSPTGSRSESAGYSDEPPLKARSRALRRAAVRLGQLALVAVVLYFAEAKLAGEWGRVRQTAVSLSPTWSLIGASCGIVLVSYAILIQVWRIALTGWGAQLRYRDAATIWTISNLGKYVPGKVWQFGAMMAMAQRKGVPSIAAGGSAILTTLTATVTGFAVATITGARLLPIPTVGLIAIWVLGAALLAVPTMLPHLRSLMERLTGRSIAIPPIRGTTMLRLILGTALSWCLYGAAFQVLTFGLLGRAPGSTLLYIAIFTGSYLIGFLAIFSPGGLIVREGALITALVNAGFDPGAAVVLAVASRLWLTALEILPALVFLLIQPLRTHRRAATKRAQG